MTQGVFACDRRGFVKGAALAGAVLVATTAVCPKAQATQKTPAATAANKEDKTPSKAKEAAAPSHSTTLLAVFSWSGNTLAVAEQIAKRIDADLLRIEPVEPYTDDYDTLLDVGRQEQRENYLPELATTIPDLTGYDTLLLGHALWWGHMPQAAEAFVTQLDPAALEGMRVCQFCTSASSPMTGCASDLEKLIPHVERPQGLHLTADELEQAPERVEAWLAELGIATHAPVDEIPVFGLDVLQKGASA